MDWLQDQKKVLAVPNVKLDKITKLNVTAIFREIVEKYSFAVVCANKPM